MRLLRLDLLAYGPFTGQSLALDEGECGLHLIFGPNEAGKSSALRALRALLYGIPTQCPDNFLHPYPQLRIGAVLQDAQGESLHLIRRKATKASLRAADDATAVDAASLARLLAGVDEAQFKLRFGIDHEGLVQGGATLVAGGGELASALFAAGTGLADLRTVQNGLSAEAAELFQARGTNPRINRALSELNDARRLRKEAQLRPDDWTKQVERLRADEQSKTALDSRLRDTRAARARAERVRQALPAVAKRSQLVAELAALDGVPELDGAFAQRRSAAQHALATAHGVVQDAAAELQRIDAELGELVVSDAVLSGAALIQQLNQELGAYQKAARDRPKLVGQRDQAEDEARAILRGLRRDPDLEQAAATLVSRPQKARIADLIERRQTVTTALEVAQQRLIELNDERETCAAELDAQPAPPDATELRRAISKAQRAGEAERRCVEGKAEQAQLQSQIDIAHRRLGLWTGPLETLPGLALPAPETVEQNEAELAEIEGELRCLSDEHTQLEERTLELASQIERLRLSHDAPTEDDLAAARRRRDALWRLVRQAWLDGPIAGGAAPLPQFLAGPPASESRAVERDADRAASSEAQSNEPPALESPRNDTPAPETPSAEQLAAAYVSSVEQADSIADRLRRESARVAEKAQLMAEQQKIDQRRSVTATRLEACRQRRQTWQDRWRACWREAGIEPLSPREMRGWLQRHEKLAGRVADFETRRLELARLNAQVEHHRDELGREIEKIDGPPPDGQSLADLLDRAEQIAARVERLRDERTQTARQLERADAQRPAAEQAAARAQQQYGAWRDQWAAAMTTLDLSADASPGEAQTVIATIDTLQAKLTDAARFRERIDGIDAEAAAFEQQIEQISRSVGLATQSLLPAQVVIELARQLEQSQQAQVRLDELRKQRQGCESRAQKGATDIERQTAILSGLCRDAGCATPEELPTIEQRSQRRSRCAEELRAVEEHLLNLAAGTSVDELVHEAAGADAADLDARAAQLADEEADLDRQRQELTEQIGRDQQSLRQMDGSDGAAEAQEQIQSLLARVRNDVDEYLRLRLSETLLKRAIERYREKNQDPVLHRASRTFAALTLDSFSGLRADSDDRGRPVLVGVRANGTTALNVEGMSDGTRDQLYLSLRLASLDHYLDSNPPLPFVVDDILIQFDDARAAAALRALADLSDRTQVIFFTHHEHLLDVARRHVPSGKLFVHHLA